MSAPLGKHARFVGDLLVQEVPELFVMIGRDLDASLALGVVGPRTGGVAGVHVALLPMRSPRSRSPGQ